MALFTLWYLPRSAAHASFLTPDEKQLAYLRLQRDSSAIVNEKLNLRDAFKIFRHGTSWLILAIQICLGVPLQSVQLFLPSIIKRLGYDTVKTNLYTVAPNVSGAAMLLILAFCSDWTRWRFPFVALGFLFTFIGFVIYAAIDVEADINVAYFASFMMTWYVLISLSLSNPHVIKLALSCAQGHLRAIGPPGRLVQQQHRKRGPPRRANQHCGPRREPHGRRQLEHLPESGRAAVYACADHHGVVRGHGDSVDLVAGWVDDGG